MAKGTIDWEHEDEAGESPLGVPALLEFELEYYYTPGEPMVRYYSDGSGYPGSPSEVEFSAICTKVDGEEVSQELGKSIGDWFSDKYQDSERVFEAVNDRVAEGNEDYDED